MDQKYIDEIFQLKIDAEKREREIFLSAAKEAGMSEEDIAEANYYYDFTIRRIRETHQLSVEHGYHYDKEVVRAGKQWRKIHEQMAKDEEASNEK